MECVHNTDYGIDLCIKSNFSKQYLEIETIFKSTFDVLVSEISTECYTQ